MEKKVHVRLLLYYYCHHSLYQTYIQKQSETIIYPKGAPGWLSRFRHHTSAQVMISQLVGSSPASGSVLTAQNLEPASDSVSPSPLPHSRSVSVSLSLSLSLKNKYTLQKKKDFWTFHSMEWTLWLTNTQTCVGNRAHPSPSAGALPTYRGEKKHQLCLEHKVSLNEIFNEAFLFFIFFLIF